LHQPLLQLDVLLLLLLRRCLHPAQLLLHVADGLAVA
jgi:hypothetical protein